VILLALAADQAQIVPNWQILDNTCNAYIRVDDADAIYAELHERGAEIDYTLYDTPWGFREFGVQDPDGHDIASGPPLSECSGEDSGCSAAPTSTLRELELEKRRARARVVPVRARLAKPE
jgi:Glyoxalase/Bleomycin resistance protein/Dioxygenase superfamily